MVQEVVALSPATPKLVLCLISHLTTSGFNTYKRPRDVILETRDNPRQLIIICL